MSRLHELAGTLSVLGDRISTLSLRLRCLAERPNGDRRDAVQQEVVAILGETTDLLAGMKRASARERVALRVQEWAGERWPELDSTALETVGELVHIGVMHGTVSVEDAAHEVGVSRRAMGRRCGPLWPSRCIALGSMIGALQRYCLEGATLHEAARSQGYGQAPDLSNQCKHMTGLRPSDLKGEVSDTDDLCRAMLAGYWRTWAGEREAA